MSAPPPLPTPPPPLRPDTLRAIGGICRLTWGRFTGRRTLTAFGVALAVLTFLTFVIVRERDDRLFYEWVINFYLFLVVPVMAFIGGGGMIRDDMKGATVDYVLTRPVRRPVLVGARFGSHLLCLQVIHAIVLGALLVVGTLRQVPGVGAVFPSLWLAQALTITAFLAMGYLCGAVTARYLVLGLLYAGTVEMGLGNIPIQLSKLSVLRHVKALLIDDFPHVFEISVDPQGPALTLAAVLAFAAIWLVIAMLAFSVQEFAGQRPKDA